MIANYLKTLLGGALFALSVANANATVLNTTGEDLVATGNSITAAYLHRNAADISVLTLSINLGVPLFLFDSVTSHDGDTLAIGTTAGASLVFTLHDLSVVNNFSTGLASTNVNYAVFDGNIAHLNSALFTGGEVLSAASVAAVNALGVGAMIIAFEDRSLPSSDHDFNDLIFGFSNVIGCNANHVCGTPRVGGDVPEPAALLQIAFALLALVGLFFARRPLAPSGR